MDGTAELPITDLDAITASLPASLEPDLGDVTVDVQTLDLDETLARIDALDGPRFDGGAARFSDDLRDVEDRLKRKSERLVAAETELDTLRAERQRAVRSAEAATGDHARQLQALTESSRRELAAARQQAIEQRAADDARYAALQAESEQALRTLADVHARELADLRERHAREVSELRETTSQELNRLRETTSQEIARLRDGSAAEVAALRAEHIRALSAAGDIATKELAAARATAAKELAAARELRERDQVEARGEQARGREAIARAQEAQAAAEARAARLDQKVAEQEAELQARARRIEELQGELAYSSSLVRELGHERDVLRGNCERQLEALQTAEGFRGVIDGLLFEQEVAHAAREREMGALIEEVAQLPRREERIGLLEGELTSLRTQSEQHVKLIGTLTSDAQAWERRLAEVNASMAAAERSAHAQSEALRVAAEHAEELQKARGLAEAMLAEERAARVVALAQASSKDADFAQLRDAHSRREIELGARETEIGEREKVAASLIDDQREALRKLQDAVEAAEERAVRVEGDLQAAEELLRQLEQEKRRYETRIEDLSRTSDALQSRLGDAERKLEEREKRVRRLESEASASAAVLGNLNQSIQRLREDTGAQTALTEPPLESMQRLFIRIDGEQTVIHNVGRRTTIGRTPDNDVCLDANFVSRHHAVILASQRATLIEDLNSTNGVIVNGRRITRQSLHDGDEIAIGTARFRFELRPSGHSDAEH